MARTPKVVEDRREQIIDAAMRAFSQKGYTRATNKDIAREAGITPGLIYHYFENKEALFKAIIESRSPLRLLNSLPPDILAMPPDTFLRLMIRQVLGIVEEGVADVGRSFLVRLPELVYNPKMAEIITGLFQRVFGFLISYFAAKMESGELRQADPALTSQILLGGVMAFVLRRQIIGDPTALRYTQEQIVDAVVDTVLNGLVPRA